MRQVVVVGEAGLGAGELAEVRSLAVRFGCELRCLEGASLLDRVPKAILRLVVAEYEDVG
jgi:hypothetical protein